MGDADAQRMLARMYQVGGVIAQNLTKAKHWYKKSANQGSLQSQHKLAAMYEKTF